jgi:magnesium chelatase family protein
MAQYLRSATLSGIDASEVRVQIDSAPGLFSFSIVGLADKAVQESADRIGSAIKNSGFTPPSARNKRFTVNLAPADIRKEGSGLDLPIALACLMETGQITAELSSLLVVGELGLDGALAHTNGIIAIALYAREAGFTGIILPSKNAQEASWVEGLSVFGADSLGDVVEHLAGTKLIAATPPDAKQSPPFADDSLVHILGQEAAKRALIVAAAGGHNILMHGAPGSGKTLLARSLVGILPPLTRQEALEVARIQSSVGLLRGSVSNIPRPFCAPHHTASPAAIIGGGSTIRPGQVSMAHRGVLFLDEFPEFARNVLEALRQPLEDGVVTVSRASGSAVLPAKFMLAASMNPCPCGNMGDARAICVCSPASVAKYAKRISGPLLDRIDIQIQVARESVSGGTTPVDIASVRNAIQQARCTQEQRFSGMHLITNSEISHRNIDAYCRLDSEADSTLSSVIDRYRLSLRSCHRIRKVARTIADLAGSELIGRQHIAEAIALRIGERGIQGYA